MKALLGKKLGMTQVFTDDALIPVTVIEVGPCVVTQIKDVKKDGYRAVQIGFGEIKDKHLNRPMKGHFTKTKVAPSRHLAEYRLNDQEQAPKLGEKLSCSVFEAGELTNVVAVSKGKGFQGVVKRWGFAGGPGGHGSHFHRAPGSIGMAATPSRVFKGMKMAGRMGGDQITVKNLEIIKVDENNNTILVKGAVPGGKGALLFLKASGKSVTPVKLIQVVQPSEEPKVEEPKIEDVKAEKQMSDVSSQTSEVKTEEPKTEEKATEPKETESVKEEAKTEVQEAAEVKAEEQPKDEVENEEKEKKEENKEAKDKSDV